MSEATNVNEPEVRRFTLDVCAACINLEGEECHTPGCTFFLWGMSEVSAFLSKALIAPVIEGERFVLQEGVSLQMSGAQTVYPEAADER